MSSTLIGIVPWRFIAALGITKHGRNRVTNTFSLKVTGDVFRLHLQHLLIQSLASCVKSQHPFFKERYSVVVSWKERTGRLLALLFKSDMFVKGHPCWALQNFFHVSAVACKTGLNQVKIFRFHACGMNGSQTFKQMSCLIQNLAWHFRSFISCFLVMNFKLEANPFAPDSCSKLWKSLWSSLYGLCKSENYCVIFRGIIYFRKDAKWKLPVLRAFFANRWMKVNLLKMRWNWLQA